MRKIIYTVFLCWAVLPFCAGLFGWIGISGDPRICTISNSFVPARELGCTLALNLTSLYYELSQ